jgi:hypothetical protein
MHKDVTMCIEQVYSILALVLGIALLQSTY